MSEQENNPYNAPQSAISTAEEFGEARVITVSGRIGRLRYLAYTMGLMFLVMVMGGFVIGLTVAISPPDEAGAGALTIMMAGVIYFLMFAASLILAIRRLNDFDTSGWFSLLFFVPIVNVILSLMLWFMPGTKGANRFGPQPPANSSGVIALSLILPLSFVVLMGIMAAIAIPQYDEYRQRAAEAQMQMEE